MGWVKIARPKYVEPRDTGERQPPTPDAFAIPVSNRVKLLDLRETHCRFPSGDPSEEDFGFCGEFADYGAPYCSFHQAIAYRPSDQSRAQDRRLLKWAVRV
jgi:GcrA cell cycle regulator